MPGLGGCRGVGRRFDTRRDRDPGQPDAVDGLPVAAAVGQPGDGDGSERGVFRFRVRIGDCGPVRQERLQPPRLVVGAEVMSRIVNPRDKKTFPLFGDAAGAVLLGAGQEEQGLLAYSLGADGQGADLLCVPAGGSREPVCRESLALERQFLRMDGRSVFKWAVRIVGDSVREVLGHAGMAPSDLDVIALHQANIRILDAVSHDLGFDSEKVIINLSRYGNTSAASVPLVLDEANSMGRLSPGALVLMSGFGAGLTWGTALMRW